MQKSLLFVNRGIPIDELQAVTAHVNYLKDPNGPHVVTGNREIIHSLRLSQVDLDSLNKNAKNGLRLYFCRHSELTDELNIIVIAVDNNNENVLKNADGTTAIINTLDPCPDECPGFGQNQRYGDSFSEKDLNWVRDDSGEAIWCKPNKTQGGKIWFKPNNSPQQTPNKPYKR